MDLLLYICSIHVPNNHYPTKTQIKRYFHNLFVGHINLGKKGYRVPQSGTIQATLFNPLGTVIKMFVVMYDLSDMPPNSQVYSYFKKSIFTCQFSIS